MSFGENRRKTWGRQAVSDRIASAVRQWVERHRSAKVAARVVEATPRSLENWINGESAPQAHHLVELMKHSDEVFAAVCEMAGRNPPPTLNRAQIEAAEAALRIISGGSP